MPAARGRRGQREHRAELDELRAALARAAAEERGRRSRDAALRRPRVHARGIGTVATGTLWTGSIGGRPAPRRAGRPRRPRPLLQVHDAPVERPRRASASPSTCRLERARPERGDALVEPGFFPVTYRLDIRLDGSSRAAGRATVHHGTAHVPAASRARRPVTRSCASRGRSSPRAATASCCARERRSAVASCSTRRRRGGSSPRGSSCSRAAIRP